MAVADDRREGCDGCGRTVSIDNLTAVTMPDGERIACCPQCEPHARRAAERSPSNGGTERAACDGCNDAFLRADLDDVELPDGTAISCCPGCLEEVPGRGDGASDDGDGASDDRDASSSETPTRGDGSAVHDDTPSIERGDERADTMELATAHNRCSQCHEVVTVELFSVKTIDGRVEEMCPTCKAIAEEKGVVKTVEMRTSEARGVLGVDADASQAEIREAFHAQVKNAHPDRKTGSRSAFKLVKEAYERLR